MVRLGPAGVARPPRSFSRSRLPTAAQAQSIEEFYRGKQLNMIIGYPPGG